MPRWRARDPAASAIPGTAAPRQGGPSRPGPTRFGGMQSSLPAAGNAAPGGAGPCSGAQRGAWSGCFPTSACPAGACPGGACSRGSLYVFSRAGPLCARLRLWVHTPTLSVSNALAARRVSQPGPRAVTLARIWPVWESDCAGQLAPTQIAGMLGDGRRTGGAVEGAQQSARPRAQRPDRMTMETKEFFTEYGAPHACAGRPAGVPPASATRAAAARTALSARPGPAARRGEPVHDKRGDRQGQLWRGLFRAGHKDRGEGGHKAHHERV